MSPDQGQTRLHARPRPSGPQFKLLLTVDEAAAVLSISRRLLYHLVMRHQILSVKVGAARRIPRQALEDYVEHLSATENVGVSHGQAGE